MARAYRYAEGDAPEPKELEAGRLIARFGADVVLGAPAGYKYLRRIAAVEMIVKAYQERSASDDWADWTHKNPDASRMLAWAMKAAENG